MSMCQEVEVRIPCITTGCPNKTVIISGFEFLVLNNMELLSTYLLGVSLLLKTSSPNLLLLLLFVPFVHQKYFLNYCVILTNVIL